MNVKRIAVLATGLLLAIPHPAAALTEADFDRWRQLAITPPSQSMQPRQLPPIRLRVAEAVRQGSMIELTGTDLAVRRVVRVRLPNDTGNRHVLKQVECQLLLGREPEALIVSVSGVLGRRLHSVIVSGTCGGTPSTPEDEAGP